MLYLSMDRVLAANAALADVKMTRVGPLVVGFFALKRHRVGTGEAVPVSSAQFAETTEEVYGLPHSDHPNRPYYRPFTQEWLAANYPAGTLYTAWQNSAIMTKSEAVKPRRGPDGVWLWRFEDDWPAGQVPSNDSDPFYISMLGEHFSGDSRIPLTDFVVWLNRGRALDDNITLSELTRRFVERYDLTEAELDALFSQTDEDLAGSLVSDPLDLEALVEALPAPSKEQPPAKLGPSPGVEESAIGEAPDDDLLLANMTTYIREVARMQVPDDLVRNVLYALRADRAVMLEGKPGTGKTRFVEAFAAGLHRALDGVADVHRVDLPISEDTTESDLIGFRDLGNEFVPGDLIRGLQVGEADRDVYVVLLDECNLGVLDAYAAKLLSAVSNGIPIDLPGTGTERFAAAGSWLPPVGAVLFGTMNSYLEDSSRKQLSVPVKRRFNLIRMPDRVEELLELDDGRTKFEQAARDLLGQVSDRVGRRGLAVFDGPLIERLAAPIPASALDQLWAIAEALRNKPEVAFTFGVVQSVLAFVQTSNFADPHRALDYQVEQKIIPLLRGDVGVVDAIESALNGAFVRSRAALDRMRHLAADNAGRIRPLA